MTTTTVSSVGSFQRPAPRSASVFRSFQREVAAFLKMVSDTQGELLRTADSLEATQPASARQLREAARRAWGFDL